MNYQQQDTEFCGKVPLNQTNLIQPHGVLVVFKHDLSIIQISENAEIVFGTNAPALINQSLATFIDPSQAEKLKERIKEKSTEGLPFALTIKGKNLLALLHVKSDYILLEIELPEDTRSNISFVDMYRELKMVMAVVDAARTTEDACQLAITELKRLTGFDKVMVYNFNEEWHGTVIAEAAEEGMDRYLGLRFPASDVPQQARAMYLKNPYRLIPDATYKPVRLYPLLNPLTNAFLDLSDVNLRSVAPVHVEYLKNMGVRTSMSTRIIHNGKLWGLISCHHRTPKYLSYENCFIFELVSNVISAKIETVQKADEAATSNALMKNYQKLLEKLYLETGLKEALEKNKTDLLELLKGDGLALVLNKHIVLAGNTPSKIQVDNLGFWLRSKGIKNLYQSTNLSDEYSDAEHFVNVGSGLLALPVEAEKGNYVLVFRGESIRRINWGGNPNEAIHFEADGKNYHPRNSFKLWQETVRNTAQPWQKEELEIAETFRRFLIEFTLSKKM